MAVIPSSPLHAPAHGENMQSPPPRTVAAPSTPFVENLASPFIPKNPGPAYPHVSNALNFYDTFAIPPAPQRNEGRPRRPAGPCDENIDVNLCNVLDPTTIFVGGLEAHGRCTWDEQRLERVFGQYGDITEVKLVRPGGRYVNGALCELISCLVLPSPQKVGICICDVQKQQIIIPSGPRGGCIDLVFVPVVLD